MTGPRYPSTADLMALRGRLMSAPSIVAECPDSWAVRTWMTGTGWQSHSTAYAAWYDEVRDGIGARDRDVIPCAVSHVGGMRCAVEAGDRYGRMRREAAALRSRAYEEAATLALVDPQTRDDLWDALRVYVPDPEDHR